MLKTLVVEDDADKRQHIGQALVSVNGFEIAGVEYVTDALTARRALANTYYDLLILDIALPPRGDLAIQQDAGLVLLDDIAEHPDRFRTPANIVGLTGFADVFAAAGSRFSSRLLTLLFYDPTSIDWVLGLQARVRHLLLAERIRARDAETPRIDLAIMCALDSPELTAVLELPWHWEQFPVLNDHTIYWKGRFDVGSTQRTVCAAAASRKGLTAAAILAMKLIHGFRPRLLAMCGMSAGIKGRVNLGDAIAANPVWDWGSGKWIASSGDSRFLPAPYQSPLSAKVREKLRLLANNDVALAEIKAAWRGPKPSESLSLHIGPLASGAAVLADASVSKDIVAQHRELLGIEMEAYAIFTAAEEASEPRPVPLVVKSVVDFGDGDKDDSVQQYGSYTSAQILKAFVERFDFS